jgi:capsule polysaccharide export protein KpsE/RkpR
MAALQEAEAEARRKQAYVERIAQPSLPDEAAEPRRLRGILTVFLLGCVAWGIIALLVAGIREHQD